MQTHRLNTELGITQDRQSRSQSDAGQGTTFAILVGKVAAQRFVVGGPQAGWTQAGGKGPARQSWRCLGGCTGNSTDRDGRLNSANKRHSRQFSIADIAPSVRSASLGRV